jgi:hypothetical protein
VRSLGVRAPRDQRVRPQGAGSDCTWSPNQTAQVRRSRVKPKKREILRLRVRSVFNEAPREAARTGIDPVPLEIPYHRQPPLATSAPAGPNTIQPGILISRSSCVHLA